MSDESLNKTTSRFAGNAQAEKSPTKLRVYIWWGMLSGLLTYLLLAITAISQVVPRPIEGGLETMRNIMFGLSAFFILLGAIQPMLTDLVAPKQSANPYFNFSLQLLHYNTAAIMGLIIGVIAGHFEYVLWPTAISMLGMFFIYPKVDQSK